MPCHQCNTNITAVAACVMASPCSTDAWRHWYAEAAVCIAMGMAVGGSRPTNGVSIAAQVVLGGAGPMLQCWLHLLRLPVRPPSNSPSAEQGIYSVVEDASAGSLLCHLPWHSRALGLPSLPLVAVIITARASGMDTCTHISVCVRALCCDNVAWWWRVLLLCVCPHWRGVLQFGGLV